MGIEVQPATDEQLQEWEDTLAIEYDEHDGWPAIKASRIAGFIARIRKAEAEVARLRADQAGFPHLHDMRQCMVDTADENKTLREEIERITESWSRTTKVTNDLSAEVERIKAAVMKAVEAPGKDWLTAQLQLADSVFGRATTDA